MKTKIISYLEKFEKYYKEERDKALDEGNYEKAFYYQNSLHSCYNLNKQIREEVKKFIQEKTSNSDVESLMYLQGLFEE